MRLKDLREPVAVKLDLGGAKDDLADVKDVSISFVDKRGKAIDKQSVKLGSELKLDPAMLNKATEIEIRPKGMDKDAEVSPIRLGPDQLVSMINPELGITLNPDRFRPFFPFLRCLDGKVRKCSWWPVFQRAVLESNLLTSAARLALNIPNQPRPAIDDLQILLPWRCRPICVGTVEIYRRRCCRRIVVLPGDIIDICRHLKRIPELPEIPDLPDFPDFPEPGPEPFPFQEADLFVGNTLDDAAIHAKSDLEILENSSFEEAQKFVLRTPRLLRWVVDCTDPVKVGEGLIGPDGTFSICFKESPQILPVNCHLEYAFKVIQPSPFGIGTITIYDGVSANKWFEADDDICLNSYHPWAIDCDDGDGDHDSPDVMLDVVGNTDAWHLNRIAQTGDDSVQPLGPNTGLVGVSGSTNMPGSLQANSNWGGQMRMNYFFPDVLKSKGARFYRVSLTPVNDNGTPVTADRIYLTNPISWQFWDGSMIDTRTLNASGNPSYYRIPYASDEQWLGVRYHALFNSHNTFGLNSTGKSIMMLELYGEDGSGNPSGRLVPTGSAGQQTGDTEADFDFVWKEEPGVSPLPNVPFAALSHVFWWDNRKVTAEILATRLNNVVDNSECQFLEGDANDELRFDMIAHHPEPKFMRSWSLRWSRGLSNSFNTIDTGTANHGTPPASPAPSAPVTVGTLLDGREKCAFSVELWAHAKTWNGFGHVSSTSNRALISFALGSNS